MLSASVFLSMFKTLNQHCLQLKAKKIQRIKKVNNNNEYSNTNDNSEDRFALSSRILRANKIIKLSTSANLPSLKLKGKAMISSNLLPKIDISKFSLYDLKGKDDDNITVNSDETIDKLNESAM